MMYWPNKKYCCFVVAVSRWGSFSIISTTASSAAEFKRRHRLTPVDTSIFFPLEYESFARTITSTYETYDNLEDAQHRYMDMLEMITDIIDKPYDNDYTDPGYESDYMDPGYESNEGDM